MSSDNALGRCPKCGGIVTEQEKVYRCQCGFLIWKQMSGRPIKPEAVIELLRDGRTKTMTFISTKNHRPFKASMVIRCGKVELDYEDKASSGSTSTSKNEVAIRVESEMSGKSQFDISGKVFREINFGIIPSRLAECYACITAVNYMIFTNENFDSLTLNISINGVEFSRCLLKEGRPRDKEMQDALDVLWELLSRFKSWKAAYQRKRSTKIEGCNVGAIPKGVFPWLEAEAEVDGDDMLVSLPQDLAVLTQFKACFPTAREIETGYLLEAMYEKEVNEWLVVVKDDFSSGNGGGTSEKHTQ